MKDVAILGLGLMGGSLGLALKRRFGASITVHGHTRSIARGELAIKRGAIDRFHPVPADAVRAADVVVLCAPILSIPAQLASVRDGLKAGAVVTDVGSTKEVIQQQCRDLLAGRPVHFIGSHPIAGSEQQGMEAAQDDLYEGAMVVVTPGPGDSPSAVDVVTALWQGVGAVVCTMTADEHDRVLATTSHLPHLLASLLAVTVGRPGLRPDLPAFCGAGYRDTTRVAEGGTDIWVDILMSNQAAILNELRIFRQNLDGLIEKLEHRDISAIERTLEAGRISRKEVTEYGF
jgi:prephenate dehydrogenase